jgi:stress response protein YsnF
MAAPEKSEARSALDENIIPVLEEKATLTTREVSEGGVRVRTRTDHVAEAIPVTLASEDVEIVRVPIGREVTVPPIVREEGDSIVVPILEEVVVTQKKLVLKEELHIKRRRTARDVEVSVTRQVQTAVVERLEDDGGSNR